MGELFEALLGGAGWGVGLGVVLGVASLAGKGVRPVAKEAIKLGMTAGARVQEWTAEMREQVDDIVAEARADQAGGMASGAPAKPAEEPLVTPSGAPAATAAKRRRAE
ncbi:MAG TPA: DUF5132 domain-containing protein [Chloroflexota bacterium]|jgi:hypothetical protein|nr:DUF5132 domain-containing protein [Chloroflexota bacterium]